MTDDELRTLVRAAVARYAGTAPPEAPQTPVHAPALRVHPSHGLFTLPAGSDLEGPCLIEPAVMCNHCGYCKSWGH